MNKILRFTALGLCAVTLLGSCKKKGTEPIPTPPDTTEQTGQDPGSGSKDGGDDSGKTPGTNTPVDNTKGIKLVLAEGQTDISITALIGNEITLEGTTTDGAFASFKPANANEVKTLKASAPGATIVIKGNVDALRLEGGSVAKLDLTQAPVTLTQLISNKTTIASADLSGAVNLTSLTLCDYASLQTLDLSKLTKLSIVRLGRFAEPQKQRGLTSVTWPTQNRISVLDLLEVGFSINTADFTSLSRLNIAGNMEMTTDIAVRNSATLESVNLYKFTNKSLILENNAKLKTVAFDGGAANTTPKVVKVTGNAELTEMNLKEANGWSVSRHITSIDLSNNPKLTTLTIGSASLFKSAGLLSVDLSGTGLKEADILAVINQLVEGDNSTRKIKLTNPTQSVKNAVQAKKWVLQ